MQGPQAARRGEGAELRLELQPLLDERGVTLKQVSEGTGLSEYKLRAVLDNDLTKVRLSTVGALSEYFGVDPREILKSD